MSSTSDTSESHFCVTENPWIHHIHNSVFIGKQGKLCCNLSHSHSHSHSEDEERQRHPDRQSNVDNHSEEEEEEEGEGKGEEKREIRDSHQVKHQHLKKKESKANAKVIFEKLPGEILEYCFSFLDVVSLCKVSLVCKTWRKSASSEILWKKLAQKRWSVKNEVSTPRKFGHKTWKQLYSHWHLHLRPPVMKGLRDSVVFARGREFGLCLWIHVRHTADCRLRKINERTYMDLRIVTQNISSQRSKILVPRMELGLKTGLSVLPSFSSLSTNQVIIEKNGQPPSDVLVKEYNVNGVITLDPMDSVFLNLQYPFDDCSLEPEALEKCDFLLVPTFLTSPEPRTVLVEASFKDKVIWESYTRVNSSFWVFNGS